MLAGRGRSDSDVLRRALVRCVRGEVHVDPRSGSVRVAPLAVDDVAAALRVVIEAGCSLTIDAAPAESGGVVLERAPHLDRMRFSGREDDLVTAETGTRIRDLRSAVVQRGRTLPSNLAVSDDATIGAVVDAGAFVHPGQDGDPPQPAFASVEIVTPSGSRVVCSSGEEPARPGIAVAVTIPLSPLAAVRVSAILGFPSFADAAANAAFVLSYEPLLAAAVGDAHRASLPHALPAGGAWILAEFGGDATTAEARAVSLLESYHRRIDEPRALVVQEPAADGWRSAVAGAAARGMQIACRASDLGEFVADLEARARGRYAIRWAAELRLGRLYMETDPDDDPARARLIDDVHAIAVHHRARLVRMPAPRRHPALADSPARPDRSNLNGYAWALVVCALTLLGVAYGRALRDR